MLRFGAVPQPMFDTQIGAMVAGFGDQVGYDALVSGLTGGSIDKAHRFSGPFRAFRESAISALVMMSKFATTSISRRIVRLSAIVWLSGVALSSSLAADAPRPDFTPNPGVGWVVLSRTFLPPPSGPGPVMDDPAHRGGTNDDFRNSGAQPSRPC